MVDEAQSFHGTTPGLWCSSRVMDLSREWGALEGSCINIEAAVNIQRSGLGHQAILYHQLNLAQLADCECKW